MLTIGLLFEDYVTRGQVGSGYGREIGSGLGGVLGGLGLGALGFFGAGGFANPIGGLAFAVPAVIGALGGGAAGNIIGSKVGSKMISNPDQPADFSNKWHRLGYVWDEGPRVQWNDILSSYNAKNRQAQALKRMGYDDVAVHSATNPGFDKNGVPNATPGSVALSDPVHRVVNR